MPLYSITLTDGQVLNGLKGPLTVTKTHYKFGKEKFERTSVALIEDSGKADDSSSEEEDQE